MDKKFGDMLKQVRIEKQMSQQELADFLGTTKQVLSKYETNQRTPKITIANEFARKLGIPLSFFVGNYPIDTQNETDFLSEHEKKLLHKYRTIDDNGKESIDTLLDTFYKQQCNLDKIKKAEELGITGLVARGDLPEFTEDAPKIPQQIAEEYKDEDYPDL